MGYSVLPNIYLFHAFLQGSTVYKVYGRYASSKFNAVSHSIWLLGLRLFSCGICLPPICHSGLFLLTFISRCLDTFDSAFNIHMMYFYMVTNFLNSQALEVPIWCVFDNSKRLTYVTSFYRSIKVYQSTKCQYSSCLQWNIGRSMLSCLYALILWVFSGNLTYLSQTISNFSIRSMFTGKVFFCVFFLPSQDALLTTCLLVSERAQYMVVCMACMVICCSIAIAPNHSRCLAGDFPLWFRSGYILQSIEKLNWFPCQSWA